jgi:hypothetical protein
MKKSAFIGLALFCLSKASENVLCMQSDNFSNANSPGINHCLYSAFATSAVDISVQHSDLSSQAEIFSQIDHLNSQVLGLTQLIQALNDRAQSDISTQAEVLSQIEN